ncbi:AAEL001899-PA [Aedes aegypti]|uniref:AAEL001899-PA n=1 Tax=Aedes aegypti TaxID=7159 RepID=Q17JX1_AEDAE|nr:AAEL001899-PA [Aedes aegypti]
MRPTSEEFLEIFQIDVTFVKEAAVYSQIVPAMIKLQQEMGLPENEMIDVFCRCYNTRVSLDPASDKVDADGVMLFENLKLAGFITEDRRQGFSRELGEFILNKLAQFHAIPIALRLLKPEVFNLSVQKFLVKIDIDAGLSEQTIQRMINVIEADLKKAGVREQLVQRLLKRIDDCRKRQANLISDEMNQYCSMLHNDLWVNNMMIKYDDDNKPTGLKFVDFQLIQMDSLVRDILFFLLTSVSDPNLMHSIDHYFNVYFDNLRLHLARLKCPNMSQFTYHSFLEEINRVAPRELYHIVAMLRVVLAKKESIPEHSELDAELFCNDNLVEGDYYRKLLLVVTIYDQQGWV